MPDPVIRPAVQNDLEVLWDFLAMAAYEPDAEAAKAVPSVAKYLAGWQRPGDFGFIAEQNGEIIAYYVDLRNFVKNQPLLKSEWVGGASRGRGQGRAKPGEANP